MTISERPGVYTSYSVSGTRYSSAPSAVAGVAAGASSGTAGRIYTITSYENAADIFGAESDITALIKTLFLNSVNEIKAVPILEGTESEYSSAFKSLCGEEDVKAIICGSDDTDNIKALKTAILTSDKRNAHKIAFAEADCGTAAEYAAAAKELNCERMVLVAPKALDQDGERAVCGTLSAAVCGALLSTADPALPLNGAALYGLGGLTAKFTDGDINTLVRGGVTPCEHLGGTTSVVRGITTKTLNGDTPDRTWQEITTVMIVDNVIPDVRDALKNSFTRAKNTAQTRGAIRTKTIIELEKKVAAEIIESYGNVSAAADESDPTVCNVTFDFTVTHGLNQIRLAAFITV